MAKTAALERIKDSSGDDGQALPAVVAAGPPHGGKILTGRIDPSGHHVNTE